VLAVLAVFAGTYAQRRWWPLVGHPGWALPGLRVDGEVIPAGDGAARHVAEERRSALESRRVRLHTDGDGQVVLEASLGELGVTADARATAERAMRIGRGVDRLTSARLADRARRGDIDVPLVPVLDEARLMSRLLPLKELLDTPAVAARLDLGEHRIREERDGRALDLDGAAAAILRAAAEGTTADVILPFTPVHTRVTRAALERIDVSHVLASFRTYFSRRGDQGPRARNIEVAASHLDGLVLGPGQVVSFNDVVGARSEENGFQKAYEIFKGEYVEGTGGGTCQVASTFHAIAFFGGLEILERLPHSRPSAYIPAGLDATVVYPAVDLKIRNPFPFALAVHAAVQGNAIEMELLGADKVVSVSFTTEVLGTTQYDRKVEEKPGVGGPKRKQKGADGVELKKTRFLAYATGKRKVEISRDVYPPTKEVWEVPPGFDITTLPPLGEDLQVPARPVGEGPHQTTRIVGEGPHQTTKPVAIDAARPSDPRGG
jgi:vancomycin resistance protein YoaR